MVNSYGQIGFMEGRDGRANSESTRIEQKSIAFLAIFDERCPPGLDQYLSL